MEEIIDSNLSNEAIAEAAQAYEDSKRVGGEKELTAKFQYAYAMLRSQRKEQITQGIAMLEALYREGDRLARRDYLYYIAVGHTRLKRYNLAIDCVEYFLQFEPENRQALQLRSYVKDKLVRDAAVGMAITGGAALLVGSLIGLALSRK